MKTLSAFALVLAAAATMTGTADAKTKKPAARKPAAAAFTVTCNAAGVSTYRLGATVLGHGADCSMGKPTLAGQKTFPNQRRVILVHAGDGMAGSGSIVLIAPGAAAKIVPVDYMTEFGEIKNDSQVVVIVQGMADPLAEPCTISKLVTLNWSTGTSTEEDIAREGACGE